MSLWRIRSLMRKEFLHILRDRRTLFIMFVMPIIQLVLLGYAATTDVEHLRTAVLDYDQTPASRALIEAYQASGSFDIAHTVSSEAELRRLVDRGRARAGMIVPGNYARTLHAGQRPQVSFVIDGSDPNVANTLYAASQSVGQAYSTDILRRQEGLDLDAMPGIDVRPRVWYNPEMKSANFMIPGIIGMILYFMTALFTSTSIVREKEQGTIEQLIVTPVQPLELILSKVAPYVIVAFFDVLEVLTIGVLWFSVPIRGSLALLLSLSGLFLLTSLGIGMLISSVAGTQQEATMLTFLTVFPSVFLGGLFFPLEAMPSWLQALTYVIPLRYILDVIRGIILKGVGLPVLLPQATALALFGTGVMLLAASRFQKRLA